METIAIGNTQHKAKMDSLGEALAGVTIGGHGGTNVTGTNESHQQFGSASIATSSSAMFALAPGSASMSNQNASTTASNTELEHGTWGNFNTSASVAVPRSTNTNANTTCSTHTLEVQENGSIVTSNTNDPSHLANSNMNIHLRNESLERFLLQSPSQALGEDVFKFSSHANFSALQEEARHEDTFASPTLSSNDVCQQQHFVEIRAQPAVLDPPSTRRRMESPTCSVTGTTTSSRSASPYATINNNTIHTNANAYQRYDPNATTAIAQSNGAMQRNGSNPSLSSLDSIHRNMKSTSNIGVNFTQTQRPQQQQPISNDSASASFETNVTCGLDKNFQLQQPALPLVIPPEVTPATGQVLYMAVPSPDGRGQVLQPVQMMQLPGKPYTYVVPEGTMGASLPQQQQPIMVLPATAADASQYIATPSSTRSSSNNMDILSQYTDATLRDDDYKMSAQQQYQTDPSIASLYALPQHPPLNALLGQIRRLSRDQVGCRLVQQALDEEGPMAATLILQEGMPFWGEAMVDPFGNYLFQKILEKITPMERIALLQNVSSRLVNASLNLHGTRSVQKIVELCAQDELENPLTDNSIESAATILTKALQPAAARLCIDSHGNHVIQRILLRLGPQHSQCIFDAVATAVGDVARHRHGCCVIQRCLDSPNSPARAHLVLRIVDKSLELMQDAYGNYVVQYVLDVCSDHDVQAVCESVVGHVNLLAIQKFSSNVMEKCLERCADHVKEQYLAEMSDPDRIRELMMDPFGNYVVQRALSVATHAQAIRLVEAMRPHLQATTGPLGRNGGVRNTAGGRRIIGKISRRFPNFALTPPATNPNHHGGNGMSGDDLQQQQMYNQSKSNSHHNNNNSHHHNHRYLNNHQQQADSGHNHTSLHLQQQPQQLPLQQQSMMTSYAPIGERSLSSFASQQQSLYTQHQSIFSAPQQQQQSYDVLGGLGGGFYYTADPFAESNSNDSTGFNGGYSMSGGGM